MKRYYGEVKWFGGYNYNTNSYNDFGYINNIGDIELKHKNIYFHKDEVISEIKYIIEGTIVSFGIQIDSKGKPKAINVDVIVKEKDLDIIERCLESEIPSVWLPVIKNYAKIKSLDEFNDKISKKIVSTSLSDYWDLNSFIPKESFLYSKEIRKGLKDTDKLKTYNSILNDPNLDDIKKSDILYEMIDLIESKKISEAFLLNHLDLDIILKNHVLRKKISDGIIFPELLDKYQKNELPVYEIKKVLERNNYHNLFLELVPKEIIFNEIWDDLPSSTKINYYEENPNISNNINELIKILQSIPEDIRFKKTKKLSKKTKEKAEILLFLHPIDIVNILWEKDNDYIYSVWDNLDFHTKILFLFKITNGNVSVDFFINVNEKHPIIRGVLKLIWVKEKEHLKEKAFKEFHNLIQNYIVEIAWLSESKIDIKPLLPECPFNIVSYCEGKPWKKEDEEGVFCPRKNGDCGMEKDFKIYPNKILSWEKWSLLELLSYLNIEPNLNDLENPDLYVNKMSGWLNRLNEIRERLKCTSCGEIMISNKMYSKNFAVYNSTIFSCKCGDTLNHNVYISHCWACREIVDSRDSKQQFEDYYLCIKCGSGPKKSNNFTQGDICPNCGSRKMTAMIEKSTFCRDYSCEICGHLIHIPPENKITGNK